MSTLLEKANLLFALAGENPTTAEEKTAYRKGVELVKEFERKNVRQPKLNLIGDEQKSRWDFFKKTQTIPWNEFFRVEEIEYTTLQIIPSSDVRNHRTEDIVRAISDLFKLPIDRISRNRAKVRYRLQEKACFEINFKNGEISFNLSVPKNVEPVIKRRVQSVWQGATIKKIEKGMTYFNTDSSTVFEVNYVKHDLYSLHTDSKDNLPLGSIFEASRLIGENDSATLFTYLEPIHQATWTNDLQNTWKRLRGGHSPKKWSLSARNIALISAIGLNGLFREIVVTISSLFGGEEKDNVYTKHGADPNASKLAIDQLSQATKSKQNKPGIKVNQWVVAQAETKEQSNIIARSLAGAYGDLAGDNELVGKEVKGKKKEEILRTINTKKSPRINIGSNNMSLAEASKLIQLPGRELQEMYRSIKAVNQKEVEVDKALLQKGLLLGHSVFRGVKTPVYMPYNNFDMLCLPTIVIGGMGQGKTKGYGANRVVEAVRNGFGAILIDPAKGEMGDEVEKSLPADKVERYTLGNLPISLDWREAQYGPRGKNRLANTMISFFNTATDEAGAQTSRFIRSAVMGMQTGYLSEIIRIFEDDKYRKECIALMSPGLNKTTLEQFDKENDGRKRQILSPIYNRLDMIMGDEYLMQCMETEIGFDFVQLTSKKKAIIIDVPKSELGAEGVDLIVNLINSKLDLAMTMRPTYMKENNLGEVHPVFIIQDEPHQYMKSAQLWKSLAVESRKWRYSFVFMFHEWKQIDKDLRDIIKSALPHYHIMPSSKHTFEGLKEEIAPFTVEDGLNLKRFHAINVIRAGENGLCKPFICKLAKPPSEREEMDL